MRNNNININEVPHYRAIEFKYMNSKIRVVDTYTKPNKTNDKIFLKFNSEFMYSQDQAYQFLIDNGFNVVGKAHQKNDVLLLFVNNWGDNFKSIKDCVK